MRESAGGLALTGLPRDDGTVGEAPIWRTRMLAFLETLPTPVVISELPDLHIAFVNQAAADFLRRPARELLTLGIADITAPDDQGSLERNTEELRREGVVVERAYVRGDGTIVRAQLQAIEPPELPGYAVALLSDTDSLHRSVRLLSLINTISGMVPSTGADITETTNLVLDVLSIQLDVVAEVNWYPDPLWRDSPALPPAQVTSDGERHRIRCPIVTGQRELGELLVSAPAVDDPELEVCLASVANILAGATSVAALRTANANSELFEKGFELSSVGMQLVSLEGRFLRVNQAFADFVGRRVDDLVGRHWRDITHAADVDEAAADLVFQRLVSGERQRHQELKRYVRPDGRTVWGSLSITPVVTDPDSPAVQVFLAQIVDVTHQVESVAALTEARDRLERSEIRYRSLVDPAPDAVFRLDPQGMIVDCNLAASRLFGYRVGESPALHLCDVVELDQVAARRVTALLLGVSRDREPGTIDRLWLSSPVDGVPGSWYQMRVLPEVESGGPAPIYVVVHDVAESVESEMRLSTLALTDPLTGVSNRAAIIDRLHHAIQRISRTDDGVAVVALDLDHFKAVNDSFGHGLGDHALTSFARAITSELRSSDSLGRLGGDEFLIVLESVHSADDAHRIVERLIDTINPLHVSIPDAHAMTLSVSAGMSYTDEEIDVDELISRADTALMEAKRHGRQRLWAADTINESAGFGPVVSSRDLMEALERRHFVVHYQPVVSIDGELVGAEALLRLRHPEYGLLGPTTFMHRALQTGLIGPIGYAVLDEVIAQLADWTSMGLPDLWVSVNAAPAELAHPGYREHLHESIRRHGVEPSRLAIEVTEHALAGSLVSTSAISDLSAIGTRIVLDDFGTGVSSLQHLRARPLHAIKIDRSFISESTVDDVNRRIVEGVIGLARSLGIDVVAEGVETREQLRWLNTIGCDMVQGWLFSRALPPESFVNFASTLARQVG
ncbi:MAG: EAL domain-containing protein [Actinomycetota bacterium]